MTDERRSSRRHPSRGTDVGLPAEGFVFCCFNNADKIRRQMFEVWLRLLRRVQGSVLWLLGDSFEAIDKLRREVSTRGVAPERLIFAAPVGSA